MSSPIPVVSPARLAVALAAAFGTGVIVATQSRINGELGLRLGDGFLAAFISFGSGLVILAVASVFWRPGRRGVVRVAVALRERSIPWWLVLGGAGGAFFVLGQGLTIGLLGVALYTIAVVCGQTVSSLLLDHWGLAHRGYPLMPATPATPRRVVGAALAVIAVGVAVSDRLRPDAPYLALVIPLVAGLVVGWQQAVNGQVRQVSGSAFTATLGNFVVGTVVLGLALVIHIAVAGWDPEFPPQWWLYLGGFAGCIFIGAQAIIVRHTGVLLMGLALLAGQVAASVVFDLVLPVSDSGLHLVTVIGGVLVMIAVVVAAWPTRAVRAS
ncbi:MAG: DMT family transporter [Pseudolysinimonas sp.]|jgi:transporter family-2 protein|uniref:DMT family transporter n=1 Tax=Pseudolysinimonas sp. TaxID=2680009 RepID=UPI003C720235